MIVICPQCRKKSRVDELKLPDYFIPVSCPHCGATLRISNKGLQLSDVEFPELPEPEVSHFGDRDGDFQENVPWVERSSIFDFRAFYMTAKEFLLHPEAAFSRWKPERHFNDALVFLVLFGSLGKILNEYWFYLLTTFMGNIERTPLESVLTFSLSALFTPIGIVIGTFVYSAITHFMLYIFKGAKKSWHSTFATMAWVSGSVSLLSVFPVVGALVASVWGFISLMVGLKVVHETSTVKSFFALTLPTIVIFGILLLFMFAILGTTLLLGLSQLMDILQQQGRFPL